MRVLIALSALLAAGCGDATPYALAGPSAALPPLVATVQGSWSGGLAVTLEGQRLSAPVTLSLDQSGTAVSGFWTALALADGGIVVGQGVGGDITGALNGESFAGTVTWDSERQGGGRCTGSSGLSGRVVGGQMMLNATSISLADCSSPTALTWNVTPGRF